MSLKAIAQELGISITTVSRALNGYDDVAEQTRKLVVEAAEARGYQPNAAARRLKTGRTDAVGLVYPMTTAALYDPNLLDIVANITSALAKFNIDILMVSDQSHDGTSPYIRLIESGRVDALIVMDVLDNDPRVNYLLERNHKFLSFGRCSIPDQYAWFDFDCQKGSEKAVQYLIQKGHTKIGYLGGNDQRSFVQQRFQGYLNQLHHTGLNVKPEWIIRQPRNRRHGVLAMQQLLQQSELPTALLIDNSMTADGAMLETIRQGLTPGTDMSFIIYDGLPPDTFLEHQATTIQLSTSEQKSLQIAKMILALINGADPTSLHELWIPEIISGDTVLTLR